MCILLLGAIAFHLNFCPSHFRKRNTNEIETVGIQEGDFQRVHFAGFQCIGTIRFVLSQIEILNSFF